MGPCHDPFAFIVAGARVFNEMPRLPKFLAISMVGCSTLFLAGRGKPEKLAQGKMRVFSAFQGLRVEPGDESPFQLLLIPVGSEDVETRDTPSRFEGGPIQGCEVIDFTKRFSLSQRNVQIQRLDPETLKGGFLGAHCHAEHEDELFCLLSGTGEAAWYDDFEGRAYNLALGENGCVYHPGGMLHGFRPHEMSWALSVRRQVVRPRTKFDKGYAFKYSA